MNTIGSSICDVDVVFHVAPTENGMRLRLVDNDKNIDSSQHPYCTSDTHPRGAIKTL